MNEPAELTKERKEVFDRIIGRKGDEGRLEPAIVAVEKFLAERLRGAFQAAEFDADFTTDGHSHKTVGDLLGPKSAAACILLGNLSGPSAFVTLPFPAVAVVADMMLGGVPELAAAGSKRPPTALEHELIKKFAKLAGKGVQTTLGIPDAPGYLRTAVNHEELRDEAADDPVVVFDTKFTFGAVESALTFAFTHQLLLKMSRLEPQRLRRPHPEAAPARNRSALAVNVKVTGSLTLQTLTLRDIAALRTGSVIAFPSGAETSVKLKAKGRPLYECGLGRQADNYALSLQRPHKVLDEVLTGIRLPDDDNDNEDDDDE